MAIEKDFDKFFNELINKKETYPERIFGRLYQSRKEESDYYRYLGESNSGEWVTNLENLFKNQTTVDLSKDDVQKIESTLDGYLATQEARSGKGRGFGGHAVVYPKLTQPVNSRFDHCWFLKTDKDRWGHDSGWDICVQKFTDDWFVVIIGDGRGSFTYWFICDEIEGLLKLIQDKLIYV